MNRLLWIALLGVCLSCSKGAPPASTPSSTEAKMSEDWFGFPSYPNTRRLCTEHVSGNGMHIQWHSYATKSSPEEVVAFYQPQTQARELRLEGKDDTRLVVFASSEASKFPSCQEGPTQEEQTIIMVSKAIR